MLTIYRQAPKIEWINMMSVSSSSCIWPLLNSCCYHGTFCRETRKLVDIISGFDPPTLNSFYDLCITCFSSSSKPFKSPLLYSQFCCNNSHNRSYSNNTLADEVLTGIQDSGIIACLRAQSAEAAVETARASLRGGISVLEVVMSTPGVFEQDARDAIRAGAKFLMSPAMVEDILDDDAQGEALYIPGVMTPTEILSASNSGAKIVKVYPVSALGGVGYIAAVRKPFPFVPMVASQGIAIDSVGEHISEGASSVVLSDAIFDKKAMSQQNFDVIYRRASLATSQGSIAVKRRTKG